MRRGKRGSGRRRLRELTRSVVETMEILEEVRGSHAGVGGLSKALVKVVKLGIQTCLLEPDEGERPSGTGITCSTTATANSSGTCPSGTMSGGNNNSSNGCGCGGSSSSSSVFLESGAGSRAGVGEQALPFGAASVLWELECCAAQALITLMNLNEGRPNHFGVFRASVYVEEIRMLEAKVLELVEQAANPREEKNARLGTTIAAGIRNCVARLWWSRRAGENAEFMTWEAFENAFQGDFGVQLPKTLEVLQKHIAVQATDCRPPVPVPLPPPPPPSNSLAEPRRRETGAAASTPLPSSAPTAPAGAPTAVAFNAGTVSASPTAMARRRCRPERRARSPNGSLTAVATAHRAEAGAGGGGSGAAAVAGASGFNPGTFAAAAAAIEATTAASVARLTAAAGKGGSGGGSGGDGSDSGGSNNDSGNTGSGDGGNISSNVSSSTSGDDSRNGSGRAGRNNGNRASRTAEGPAAAAAAAEMERRTATTTNAAGGATGAGGSLSTAEGVASAGAAGGHGTGGGGGPRPHGAERVVFNVDTGEEERQQEATGPAMLGTGAGAVGMVPLERSFSRLLLSARRGRGEAERGVAAGAARDNAGAGSKRTGGGDSSRGGGGSDGGGKAGSANWRVPAALYEEVTWAHGGLYEAFQVLADPRRVVFAMGVVDDGPHTHHEGGDGFGENGWPEVSPVEGLLGLSVQQVCCGGQHAAVLTDCGEIFTWGRGGFGRLGHGNREVVDSPKRIEALAGVPCVQVACGFAYTAAVTASGELYTWGAGENGRLGLGDVEDRHTPCRVEGLHSKVKEVYAGSVHSCVLTREGTVYAFGKHEYTGHGDKEDVLEPRLIPTFSGSGEAGGDQGRLVRQISVGPGGYHTMALTCQGRVYAWGHNRVAQLGIGNSFTVPKNLEGAYFLPSPQLVESLVGMNIVKVVAGWGHSAALTVDGQLYVCGRNYRGQLGLGSPQGFPLNERGHPFQADFCLVDRLQHLKIKQIACGGEHSVALAENGEVWSFGAGQKGQLGHESTTREHFPRLVQALKRTRRDIMHVACGNNCTLVLAGGVAFPTLSEMTAAVIRGNPRLWADAESLGLLPPSVVDSLNRTVSD